MMSPELAAVWAGMARRAGHGDTRHVQGRIRGSPRRLRAELRRRPRSWCGGGGDRRRRVCRGYLGWRRRYERHPVGPGHDRERVLHHQDHGGDVHARLGRSGRAGLRCARVRVLARVRPERQGGRAGAARHVAHGGPARIRAAGIGRGSVRPRRDRRTAGCPGTVVGAGHQVGLPRGHPGQPRGRDSLPHHRPAHGGLVPHRNRRAARRGLLDEPARVGRPPRRRAPAAPVPAGGSRSERGAD